MKQISIFLFAISFLMLSGCTKKTDNYYINEAAKALSMNNFTLAVSAYDKLISEYPNSPKAPFALFQTATFYQNKQVKQDNLTDTKSFEEAVARFRRLFDSYPNDRLSSRALFMSGFIQANDLKQYSQAAATFNLFLKKYPDNELVVSVKEELNNMGLSPEEIIQRKESSVKNASSKQ